MLKKLNKLFYRKKQGYIMILVAAALPLIFFAINYLIKQVQTTHKSNIKVSTSQAIGSAILETYNPALPWDKQLSNVYSAAAQTLNDRSFELEKKLHFPGAQSIDVKTTTKTITDANLVKMYSTFSMCNTNTSDSTEKSDLFDISLINSSDLLCDKNPFNNISFNKDNNTISYEIYSTTSGNKYAYSVISYPKNTTILQLSYNKNHIACTCPKLNKNIKAYPAICNVDLVIAIPTNHAACTNNNSNSAELIAPNGEYSSTPIIEIADSCREFLQNNFLHTKGVAVGVIPYSAKISLPPNRAEWTVKIPPMSQSPTQAYFKQITAYGTDGKYGGQLIESDIWGSTNQGESYTWGNDTVGLPIMYRRGTEEQWRGLTLYKGDILSSANPSATGRTDQRFQQMNTNPCYMGHCNTLCMVCEYNCPTYMANPYYITELTDNVQSIVHDLQLIRPINDDYNKSNFLFLPLSWAKNLLSNWTFHPSSVTDNNKPSHPSRDNKSKAIIIIVNAPDNFAPKELTYLGFNNDNSEIPMMESDAIVFKNGGYQIKGKNTYQGTKGIIEYKNTKGNPVITENGGLDYLKQKESTPGQAKITILRPGIIRIVAELAIKPQVEFYNDNGVSENIGKHTINDTTNFSFGGPKQVINWTDGNVDFKKGNYTTKGPNFAQNFSINKLKCRLIESEITEASLTKQVLRFCKELETSEMSVSNINNGQHKYIDPCIQITDQNDNTKLTSITNNIPAQAYNLCLACQGIGQSSTLVMAAENFPALSVLSGDKTIKIRYGNKQDNKGYNSNQTYEWHDTDIDITTAPGKYRVIDLYYDNDNKFDNGKTFVFTGALECKTKETYYGRYASKKYFTRSPTNIMLTSTALVDDNQTKNNFTEIVTYNNQIELKAIAKCTKDDKKCGCPLGKAAFKDFHKCYWTCRNNCLQDRSNCRNKYSIRGCFKACQTNARHSKCSGSYKILAGGWSAVGGRNDKDYFLLPVTKNCANIGKRLHGCSVGLEFKRSNSCYKEFDENGMEIKNNTNGSGKDVTLSPDEENTSAGDPKEDENSAPKYPESATEDQTGNYSEEDEYSGITVPLPSEPNNIESGDRCHAEDILIETLNENCTDCHTIVSYDIIYKADGSSTTEDKKKYLESPYIEWLKNLTVEERQNIITNNKTIKEDPKITYEPYEYNLYNFFFVNSDTVLYSSSATENDITSNKCIGSNKDKDNNTWIQFCGDGQLSLTVSPIPSTLEFKNINMPERGNSFSSDNNAESSLVIKDTSYKVINKRVFYIDARQFLNTDEPYSFNLSIGPNIRIVSAEILNFPYETLIPSVEMYENEAMINKNDIIDVATNDDGSSEETVIFKTNKKSAFTVEAMIPFAWTSGITDFRQTEKKSKIYSNSDQHSFSVEIIAPTLAKDISILPTSFNNRGGAVTIYSDRKLSSFKLNGNYDYVSEEYWVKEYLSHANYKRSNRLEFQENWNIVNTDDVAQKTAQIDINQQDEGITISGEITYECQDFNNGDCNVPKDENNNDKEITEVIKITDNTTITPQNPQDNPIKAGWKRDSSGYGGIFKKCKNSENTSSNTSCLKQIIISHIFTRSGNCSKDFNYKGEITNTTCGEKDALSITKNTWSKHICIKKYSNDRTTSNQCMGTCKCKNGISANSSCKSDGTCNGNCTYECENPETDEDLIGNTKLYGSSYKYLANKKINQDPITKEKSEISENKWFGSFGKYRYIFKTDPISELANVKNITISDTKDIYTNGSFGSIMTENCTQNDEQRKSDFITAKQFTTLRKCFYYEDTATNCTLKVTSRTNRLGQVGNTQICAKMTIDTQSVEINPDQYEFTPDGNGNYIVKIECKNVVLSNPKMIDTSEFIRYAHPNLEKDGIQNVQIIDGQSNKTYGDISHDITRIQLIEHLNYLTLSDGDKKYFELKDTNIKDNGSDFFAIFWDYDSHVPSVSWTLNQEGIEDKYTTEYSFSGVHRVFFPYGIWNKNDDNSITISRNIKDDNGTEVKTTEGDFALLFAGFTVPLNYALYNGNYQKTGNNSIGDIPKTTPKAALEAVAKDACTKLKESDSNQKIYIIKYRTSETTSLDDCSTNIYNASSKTELIKTLHIIAKDIKTFANATDGYVTQEDINNTSSTK